MIDLPPVPNEHALFALILTVLALIMFSRDQIPLETSSLLIITLLTLAFTVWPYNRGAEQLEPTLFFTGFGHEALIAISALMVAGHGLVRTGALEPVGRTLSKLWRVNPILSFISTLTIAAVLSAFVNNTPIVVLLLPILISVSIRTQTPASGLLMPIGFATILGGMTTTIGTSTNLLVVSVAADLGLPRIGIFDFLAPASVITGVGIIYLWLIAPRLLPDREAAMPDASPRLFTAHIKIPKNSFADGKTMRELIDKTNGRLQVTRIRKSEQTYIFPLPDATVRTGDRLLVKDTPQNLKEFETILEGQLYSGEQMIDEDNPLSDENQHLAEIAIDRGSPLVHRTLNGLRFADTYQVATLAIHRKGRVLESMPSGIGKVRLRLGDILLVQGSHESIEELKHRSHFLVLDATTELPHTHRASRALIIMAFIVLTAAFGLLPIAISATCGALLMLVTNCLDWRDIQRALSTQVIFVIVASLALGNALILTGATEYLASSFLVLAGDLSTHGIFAGLVFLMAFLTNIVSNSAAAVIGTPIAVSIAQQLGLSPEAFVLGVLFGANMSFATPMAYHDNLMVMNAAGYSFSDFVKVGLPMTILLCAVVSWILPVMYPF